MNRFIPISIASLMFFTTSATAQSLAPEIVMPSPGSSIIITKLSDNGLWGVSETGSVTDGDIRPSGGVLFNMQTLQQTDVSHSSGLSGVADVTDDGSLIVGECNDKPAYYTTATSTWTNLPLPSGFDRGRLTAVTPDGRYAVGYAASTQNILIAAATFYDLSSGTLVDLPNVPVLDMTNEDQKQNCFYDLSPDGRYILGELSQSYMLPIALCSYVYDRETATYKIIGFTENHSGKWRPKATDLAFTTSPTMSPNGQWVTGAAYCVTEVAGSEWPVEQYFSYRYNVADDTIELFNGTGENDMMGFAILNDGTMIAVGPAQNPYASAYIRSGKYFISVEEMLKQVYGINFQEVTSFSNTGKPLSVSGDGSTMVMFPNTTDTYIFRFKEPVKDAAARVNLLGNYTVTPAAGSEMSSLRSFKVVFDRQIEVNGVPKITFTSEDGSESYTPVSSNGISANGNTLNIVFRTRTLTEGVNYKLTIPKGQVRIKGDQSITSELIEVNYTGRSADPVKLVEAYPADGSSVASIDLTSNPILLTFDTNLTLKDGAEAYLYRSTEDEPYCTLNVLCSDKRLLLYPTSKQNLFSGTDYRIEIPAGIVTDVSSGGANEAYTINYRGAYVREVSADDRNIFNDNCSTYDNFMFYDGDQLQPASAPASWGFTNTVPWYIVRSSNETTDMAMASHSMYSPAGKADDWMVTPQLFIPDADCYLSFDAQSYLNSAADRLKVYVYPCTNVYNTLTKDIVEDIRANGKLVFDEQLSPGSSEEGLEDDWTNYIVRLDEYAGQDVYIAFVNDNENQSAVFIDNVKVIHDMRYLTTFDSRNRVVNQDEIAIRGTLTIATEIETYDAVDIALRDATGKEIDRINESGVSLKKGDVYNFEFSRPLPLERGVENKFSIAVDLNGRTTIVNSSVKNLTFEPYKRVVIEEYSGAECVNCPLGIVAMENLLKTYPGQVIPVVIRTYSNDMLGTGLHPYSQYLGLDNFGAPSAVINRSRAGYPMISVDGDYRFSGAGIIDPDSGNEEMTWIDHVGAELLEPAETSVDFVSVYDDATQMINVTAKVRSALNTTDNNLHLFAVVTENDIETYQSNGYSSNTDPDLGEWGKGGVYGTSLVYPYMISEVARGTWGTTYNGTGGLIPATMNSDETYEAKFAMALPSTVDNPDKCQLVLMLINAGTGTVVNANIASINGATTALDTPLMPDSDNISLSVSDGNVVVNAPSAATVMVYDVAGRLIGEATGDGTFTVELNGYRGVAMAKTVASDGSAKAHKLVIR